jgi:transcriptional regulator with XRE-family HTH domain
MKTESFGITLNTLRKQRRLTVHQLAKMAGVHQSLISGLNTDSRIIGEVSARKIAKALGLEGSDQEAFVYLAINNCSDRVLAQFKQYPAEALNLVASVLANSGISAEQIVRFERKPDSSDASIYLADGKAARINLEVAIE